MQREKLGEKNCFLKRKKLGDSKAMKKTFTQQLFSFLRDQTEITQYLGADDAIRIGALPDGVALPAVVFTVKNHSTKQNSLHTVQIDKVNLYVVVRPEEEIVGREILNNIEEVFLNHIGGMIGEAWAYNIEALRIDEETLHREENTLVFGLEILIHSRT